MKGLFRYCFLTLGLLLSHLLPPCVMAGVDARLLRYPDVSATQVVFVYAGDIWVAPKTGGTAMRLSSPRGEETIPRFSPDGTEIAFSGNYGGNMDIYIIPVTGGSPRRITHHPARDSMVDWYPDGGHLLFASSMKSDLGLSRFFKTPRQGGLPTDLPLPYGVFAAISPDGKKLAFTTVTTDYSTWNRYRGGRAPDIWLFDTETKDARNITQNDANDSLPMWHGSTIYFLSDRGPNQQDNIWAHNLQTRATRQVTFYKDFEVRFPAIGPSDMVFENGGRLYLMALENEKIQEIKIDVLTDRGTLVPKSENVARLIRNRDISPNGKRVVLEARGDIFTVPAEHGVPLNLTHSPGTAERYPTWSPDGRWIAYFSDRDGEYRLTLRPSGGSGPETPLTPAVKGYRYRPQWSPDSRKLLFVDKGVGIRMFNRDDNSLTTIDDYLPGLHGAMDAFRVSWSPDSRWIAYSKVLDNNNRAVFIYDCRSGRCRRVTDGFYYEWNPVFDPDGRYLYFLSCRDLKPVYSDLQDSWVYINTVRIVAMTLRRDVPSPLMPRNDREEIAPPGNSPKDPKNKKDKKNKKSQKDHKKGAPPAVTIDWEGLEQRLEILPPGPAYYNHLAAVPGKLLYLSHPRKGSDSRARSIMYYDLEKRKEETVLTDVRGYITAPGGQKILAWKGTTHAIVDVKPKQSMKKTLAVDELEMVVEPMTEWRQVFVDSWRFMRDFFYDRGLHGIDWEAMRRRYGALLEDAVTRYDLHFIVGRLIAEVGAGHVYRAIVPGERPLRRPVGLLGADFELHKGAYRIKTIIDVGPHDTELRSPLRMPGINVKEGDYLLAVNGVTMDTTKDPWAAFQGLAGKAVILTINSTPEPKGAREVVVKTLRSEQRLREQSWVEANRRKVAQATNGRVGYIYVRDTGVGGQTEFVRQYLAQHRKDGLIIDERFNRGGQLAHRFIEMMTRPLYNKIYVRDGRHWRTPETAHTGPKVMLMNGWSGSGGDAFPYYFRKAGLGPLIGTRTWGGLVGPVHYLPLIDGSRVSAPPGRFYSATEGKWAIENIGVEPDIHLVNNPGLMAQGRDPQLERGIQMVMEELKKNPPQAPKIPVPPGELTLQKKPKQ